MKIACPCHFRSFATKKLFHDISVVTIYGLFEIVFMTLEVYSMAAFERKNLLGVGIGNIQKSSIGLYDNLCT